MGRFVGISIVAALIAAEPVLAEDVDLKAIRAAVEKYRGVEAALADGYIPDPSGVCVSAAQEGLPAEWGGMGIHYLNPALLKLKQGGPRVDGEGTSTDWIQPAILLYEPRRRTARSCLSEWRTSCGRRRGSVPAMTPRPS